MTTWKRIYGWILRAAALALIVQAARADDGGISFGGSPHLLKGHATVAMKSEVVKMDVHDKVIKVDCRFLFHNSGPACTVRMGFPDEGTGAAEPYQGFPVPRVRTYVQRFCLTTPGSTARR